MLNFVRGTIEPALPGRDARTGRIRRGFTLLEALMAAGILLMVVVAVTSAITAGQQHALEARQRIAATLAAEEIMGRVIAQDYDILPSWNGYTEDAGMMTTLANQPFPGAFAMIGRRVHVTSSLQTLGNVDVVVAGRSVCVRAFDADARVLADITRFVPEPQE